MTAEFRRGELVDITIKAARVVDAGGSPDLKVRYDHPAGPVEIPIYIGGEGLTVERVAPAEWPPRPGDLWLDGEGDFHFCVDASNRPDDRCLYDAEGIDRWASTVLNERGPMKLLQRRRAS